MKTGSTAMAPFFTLVRITTSLNRAGSLQVLFLPSGQRTGEEANRTLSTYGWPEKWVLKSELDIIVNKCIPAAVWDAKNQKDISWSSRGYKFEEYRRELAELLSSGSGNK